MKKPSYLRIPEWADMDVHGWANGEQGRNIRRSNGTKKNDDEEMEKLEKNVLKASDEIMQLQKDIGIDIITDGEMRRNNYIYPFCETLNGFNFQMKKEKVARNGKWKGIFPCVVSEISLKSESERADMSKEWEIAQGMIDIPVKYTIPGPLTISDTVYNDFYEDEEEFLAKLAVAVNQTILQLVAKGCKYIQVDEPVLARYPKKIAKAIKNVERCFEGVPNDVTKIVHVCCGYPVYLDQKDYEKADLDAYLQIADALNESIIDQISLEDAHRRNGPELFKRLHKKTIILGVICVCSSRVESVDEIREHIRDVLQYLPRNQVMPAPDCGLIMLPDDIMKQKMKNLVEAARTA